MTVRWGMIGCGAVTEVKSGPAYYRVARSRLVGVSCRRAEAAFDYAKRHKIERVFLNSDELISSEYIDAVYIATPPSSHVALALRVAKAGKPCCVEKPIAPSHADAAVMIRAFEKVGKPLFVAYYRRSLPRFRRVKEWLEAGLIGDVRHVHWGLTRPPTEADLSGLSGWRTDPAEAPGGYFDDLACHGLDLFDYLVGPIAHAVGSCSVQQQLYQAPDAVSASWAHVCGATGSGFWNFAAGSRSDEVKIVGSMGYVTFSVFEDEPLKLVTETDTTVVEIANPENIQAPHVENIIRHLEEGLSHPSTGESAARTAWVSERILLTADI